ncbi:uncharacterized protein SPPG_07885 [Spizellomyces punctatus DAOM BR117]|uniref:HIT-type domain-containing protein n=1 Tax=Spizellomyces punctatus (strain DAOM BR117) TaxID=645134 RepID=A0A0L0H7K7_SPIPD|nr:uncharacterized protein SPPG_07885 [Spizellomyces punctatus DAOM BR117]KNC96673.1 hypothetical protein SPPG_07885 [Spizellomyces punctatus DAOM BR117]|eukprot:XP_016604713.1 hypothetical protein SPPG_07885 [Spizellomyces punctatus DAOM BR117]
MSDDQEEPSPTARTASSLCEVCQAHPYKYKCPGCLCRTCSLACSRSHKDQSGCTGQRDKTQFIKVADYTANDMTSDYTFLEDIYRTADNATRDNDRLHSASKSHNVRQRVLAKQCKSRGIRIKFMPAGMKRHDQNQSIYIQKREFTSWTVEWDFQESKVTIVDHRVKDTDTVEDLVAKHVEGQEGNAVTRYQIQPYCERGLKNLLFYMKMVDVPANQTIYLSINPKDTLRDALRGKTVIEFPTIIIRCHPPPVDVRVMEDVPEHQKSTYDGPAYLLRRFSQLDVTTQPVANLTDAAVTNAIVQDLQSSTL